MKKILFIITISVVSIFAKPCMTDIYFGNGVWNTPTQASKSVEVLRKFMQINYNARLDRNKEGETYLFKLVYNPSRGTIEDLLETFWQLKESGQISEGYFMAKWNLLTADRGPDELRKAINRVAATSTVDVNRMYNTYNNTSFSKKHDVLLVAHSQGNLFGNKIYTMLTDTQKKKFRMVSVGTPANHVMKPDQTAPYVTAKDDFVINRVSGALTGNVDGFGHTFIGTYLSSSFEARTQIALYVKNAYDDLMQTTSCIVYEAVYMKIYDVDTLEVYAFTTNTFPRYHDLLDTIALETYDATRDSNNELTCGSPTYRLSPNTAFSSCTYETGTSCSWKPGALYKDVLEQRKGTTHHILHNGKCTTLSLSGELYDLVESALK